jgi:hydroxyacid-oxoacid transhydrogenase
VWLFSITWKAERKPELGKKIPQFNMWIVSLKNLSLFLFFRDRALRPLLGIIDPEHTLHCGPELTLFSGLDVLCHALESFTAVPYKKRGPRPATPMLRPAYQGCNPVADIWSGFALQQCSKFLPRAIADGDDMDAREAMCLASSAAGVGFGNAGVHLCHGMSYPIASNVKAFRPKTGYESESILKKAIVPHGLSVVLSAPAVFRWTCSADPDRHLRAAELLGKK